ncbi:hypothetical protein PJ267_14840 [Arthrobacter sp. OVS8]|nr:hypothetical protein PJ267_14840 [Arthrobacter sp. OVS8]
MDVTIKRVPAADVRGEVQASGAELGIIIPEGLATPRCPGSQRRCNWSRAATPRSNPAC